MDEQTDNEITADDAAFIARLEAREQLFQAWQNRRQAARSKLMELGLTGDEVDSILEGPTWEVDSH